MARRAVVAIACAFTAVALTSCGSREAEVLGTAFNKHIDTADVTVKVDVSSKEIAFGATLAGPYQSRGEHRMPAFDFNVDVAGPTPRPISGRVISTGENWFIQYKGETYEAGEDVIREAEEEDKSGPDRSLSPAEVQKLLEDARDWFPDSETQEDATLSGEQVTRVTGKLNVEAALKDLADLIGKRGGPKLGDKDIEGVNDVIKDARFTVDVGRADGKLRRIVAHLEGDDDAGGTGTIDFSIQWQNVDKPVTIKAPRSGKPLQALDRKLKREFGDSDSQVS
jgi:hypothetical protein